MGIATFLVGLGADLCEHRHLGRGHPDRAALRPGRRRRRRVGRLGAAVDGMGAHQPRIAASSPPGRNSACRPGCSSPISPCWSSARIVRRPVPRPGAGGCRSCSASCWSAIGFGSGSAFSRRPSSPAASRRTASRRAPMLEVFRRQPKEIFLSAFARMGEQAPFYIFTAFVFSYGIDTLHGLARLPADRGAGRVGGVVLLDPVRRPSVGPLRPQAHLHARRGRHRRIRLGLFRLLEHASCRSGSFSRSCCR